jgi:hypothetical protein
VYFNLPYIEPWDIEKNAFLYKGSFTVIAHPPCERWGKYWGGGPNSKIKKLWGDDQGAFYHSLWCVRQFGGVIEHPEASKAFAFFGLPRPRRTGGWSEKDKYGGRSCCVAQGHYGHLAQKFTWLYAIIPNYPEMVWGKCVGKVHCELLSKKERTVTPVPFRNMLISWVGLNGFIKSNIV